MGRCVKCGKKTKYAINYDIDSSPIFAHKKCEMDVKMAIMMMISDEEMFKDFIKDWYWSNNN